MPIYEFVCERCGRRSEGIFRVFRSSLLVDPCKVCGGRQVKVPSAVSISIAGNAGPKLRTRVGLSDELGRLGLKAPLFGSEEKKEKARWVLRKSGVKVG